MKEKGNEGTRERERERDDRLRKIREDRVKEPRSRISARSRNAVRDRWRASKKDDEISFDFLHFFFFFLQISGLILPFRHNSDSCLSNR